MARKPFEKNPPKPKQDAYPCGCPYDLARQEIITEIDKRLEVLKNARVKYYEHMTPGENGANAGAMNQLRSMRRWIEKAKDREEKHRRDIAHNVKT